jgi:8-oxo-dGTP pyrophosphatase MutT (NUDIX family)
MGGKSKFPCSGIIVFKYSKKDIYTILVKSNKGHYSFPKGKKKKKEIYTICALRELYEETNVTLNDITFIRDKNKQLIWLKEYSEKGNPSVIYLVAKYINNENSIELNCDSEELECVEWISVKDAMKLTDFKQSRKDVLLDAISFLSNN